MINPWNWRTMRISASQRLVKNVEQLLLKQLFHYVRESTDWTWQKKPFDFETSYFLPVWLVEMYEKMLWGCFLLNWLLATWTIRSDYVLSIDYLTIYRLLTIMRKNNTWLLISVKEKNTQSPHFLLLLHVSDYSRQQDTLYKYKIFICGAYIQYSGVYTVDW